jgi:UTP--glucose-1-phosphate uridylyltransferase
MKAVIAAGGYSTGFLPTSKVIPKEMLPILGKPMIHHQVNMLLESGITEMIVVVRHGSDIIHQYFQANPGVEGHIGLVKAAELLGDLEHIRRTARISYTHELEIWPYGDAEALLAAEPWLNQGEPFYCLWVDDVIWGAEPVAAQLIRSYEKHHTCIVAISKQPIGESRYWSSVTRSRDGLVASLIPRGESQSPYAQLGHFIFDHSIFDAIRRAPHMGELWIGNALKLLIQQKALYCVEVEGLWLAAGDWQRYLVANRTAQDYVNKEREK